MNILLLNAGSSSLKSALMDRAGNVIAHALADWAGDRTQYRHGAEKPRTVDWRGHSAAVERFLTDLSAEQRSSLTAVGHRIVHGGPFTSSVRITPEVRRRIAELIDLAPLHNPPSLEALGAAESQLPNVPHVAVFDTAFHATLPAHAHTYPVPASWTRDWGIRRYGFHGLSHAYCAGRAMEMLAKPPDERSDSGGSGARLVICHLGHGCSASAVRDGQCIDTTMGFTPLDGLMMATRCGSIDPSILLHVQEHHGLTPAQLEKALNRESGLLGVSGVSADMRDVLAAAKQGNAAAQLALDIYAHRVRQTIGAFTATLGGIDALVLTAGVGENAADVREAVCAGLQCLGLDLDAALNASSRPDADIATCASAGRILVIATREDITMLKEVTQVIEQGN